MKFFLPLFFAVSAAWGQLPTTTPAISPAPSPVKKLDPPMPAGQVQQQYYLQQAQTAQRREAEATQRQRDLQQQYTREKNALRRQELALQQQQRTSNTEYLRNKTLLEQRNFNALRAQSQLQQNALLPQRRDAQIQQINVRQLQQQNRINLLQEQRNIQSRQQQLNQQQMQLRQNYQQQNRTLNQQIRNPGNNSTGSY